MPTTTDQQYHIEWQARKGKRVAKAAINAREYKRYRLNGKELLVKVAQRSKGFRSNYELVKTYFLILYQDGAIINGWTKTPRQWQLTEAQLKEARDDNKNQS